MRIKMNGNKLGINLLVISILAMSILTIGDNMKVNHRLDSEYWAILVCGSNDFNLGFETDIRDMFLLLKEIGYNENNIYYVAPQNWNGAKNYYSISQDNVRKAIDDVAEKIGAEDVLFFYYTAHGSYQSLDGNGDKNTGASEDVSATELDSWLDEINAKQFILLQGCKTGSFISKLSQNKRIIVTSTDDKTSSWEDMLGYGDPEWDPNAPNDDGANNPTNRNWDGSEFSSGFRMAFRDIDNDGIKEGDKRQYINKAGKKPDKTAPYGNEDGKLSIIEAFNFAEFEDYCSPYWETFIENLGWQMEHPQISYTDLNPYQFYIYAWNHPPEKPTITGPNQGKVNEAVYFNSYTNDPDGDDIYYLFDWGDGNYSVWLGPYSSGEVCNVSHIWATKGNYSIRVKAKDENGLESEWSDEILISIPKKFSLHPINLLRYFLQKMRIASNIKIS
ncbi:MAG: C13 family peptidase [Candidatus Thermoplasmatota archaeon]